MRFGGEGEGIDNKEAAGAAVREKKKQGTTKKQVARTKSETRGIEAISLEKSWEGFICLGMVSG